MVTADWGKYLPGQYFYHYAQMTYSDLDSDPSDGQILTFTAYTLKEAQAVVRQAINENRFSEYMPRGCGHEHDCCGCPATAVWYLARTGKATWVAVHEWFYNY